jgi:hypothetical protein
LAGIRFLGSVRQVVTAQTGSARLGGLALIAACVLCTWLVGRMHHLLGSFLGLSLPDVPGSAVVSFLLGGRICCDWIVLGEKLSLQAMVVAVMVLTYGVVRLLVFSTAGSKQLPIERGPAPIASISEIYRVQDSR